MPDPTERYNKVPKTKRVRSRNMRDPLSPSSFDEFKKIIKKKDPKSSQPAVKLKKEYDKKVMQRKATPPAKRTKETQKKEMLKANQIRIKKNLGKPKKGKLMGSGKKMIKKK